MKIGVFDIECDGFNPTKIHCLSAAVFSLGEWRVKSTTSYDDMIRFFESCDVLVGHNIIRFDIPVVERLLGVKVEAKLVDTLPLSWYLYSFLNKHGLADWGEYFGIPKPKVEDWDNQPIEVYINRCEEDVKINCKLWDKQYKDLDNLYDNDENMWEFIDYISFKMYCARSAEKSGWKLDVSRCEKELENLLSLKQVSIDGLKEAMPKVPVKSIKSKPNKLYKKDGSLSTLGEKWFTLLHDLKLPEDYEDDVTYLSGYKEPNPNSVSQIKDWLTGLGWVPENFDFKVKFDESGKKYTDKIPQIRIIDKGEKLLCPSVKNLMKSCPEIEHLEGLTVLTHRMGILKSYLKNVDDNGYLQAKIMGLTNTLRFKHGVIVNLPSASKPYGDIVRGVLIAPEGYELCGSDMSSLEDRMKQHYMWDFDPDYVREMQTEDFDPHLALAEFAGALTPDQVQAHKDGTEKHSATRHLYKTANYSCTYGAGGKKLAMTLKISEEEGHAIVKAYRDKNWAINSIAESVKTKDCLKQKWLYNPVSKFWYSLRHEKDKFSTLNQGSGVFAFDLWIKNFMEVRSQLTGQMHDEVILCVKKGYRKECEKLLRDAIVKTNEQLQLNRSLDIDVQFGDTYADIH